MGPKKIRLMILFISLIFIFRSWYYVWYTTKCPDDCCCNVDFYWKCMAFLYPPTRAPLLATATRPTTDHSNWMTRVQSKKLHQIVLPGSHHTGVNILPGRHLMDKWDIPQKISVLNQLKAGVRFMDIRLSTGPYLNQPSITHNYKYQDFEKLVKDTVYFLKSHQNEVVVMWLSEGQNNTYNHGLKFRWSWSIDWRKVDSILNNSSYQAYVYSSQLNPLNRTIANLRGKIIICQRPLCPGISSFKRMTSAGSWPTTKTNTPDHLVSKMASWVNTLPSYSISKFYFLEALCAPTAHDIMYSLWLFSGCKRSGNHALYKYTSLEDLAMECNHKVYKWLQSHSFDKLNAVMTDFVNPKIMNLIISKNY